MKQSSWTIASLHWQTFLDEKQDNMIIYKTSDQKQTWQLTKKL